MREVFGIGLVEGTEVGDVGEEAGGLDHVRLTVTGVGQQSVNVLEDLGGLRLDLGGGQGAIRRVDGHHTGKVEEAAGLDSLGIGADCRGGVGGGNVFKHGDTPCIIE